MYEYKIKNIIKVYDGDTITVEIDLGFGVSITEHIRFAMIDTPEVRGESREQGLISRDWLREKLQNAVDMNRDIIIRTHKDSKGKYGRYIGLVYIDDVNNTSLNMQLVDEGLAVLREY
jgi:micrococcal nuclease